MATYSTRQLTKTSETKIVNCTIAVEDRSIDEWKFQVSTTVQTMDGNAKGLSFSLPIPRVFPAPTLEDATSEADKQYRLFLADGFEPYL